MGVSALDPSCDGTFSPMLIASAPPGAGQRERQRVDLWNRAHSLESRECQLGLWMNRALPTPMPALAEGEPFAVLGWQGPTSLTWTLVPLAMIRQNPDLLGRGTEEDVVLAHERLPSRVWKELQARFGYTPKLPGQVDGWWFVDNHPVPRRRPSYRSTLAVLPNPHTAPSASQFNGLLLVDVANRWLVLSKVGLPLYQVGAALNEARPVHFVQWHGSSRTTWTVDVVDHLAHRKVEAQFGAAAARRARSDAQSIVVRCRSAR